MTLSLVTRIACVAIQYEFYAHFIRGYIEEKPWSWNIKQQVADQILLAVLTLRQQGRTPQCLL